ncbi:tripartite tricarboxylate transporter TctB family protein [Nocardioides panzhihuensis]|uniref:ABC-type Na+ efflux pump permease subunit n=1 Tax=Nocardioides panzhihuensis TaxID=860243 RepID=A0A7Z0DP43_9ACTN|nr:tripartite tricarboxylate transporter TctB family protein [Nocardioides panzhihuensis]NYI78822.1 ABC-type Na+ efflux pump permease subunit [Nocardioides panzhihuensis]
MSDERTPAPDQDILAEIQAEVAHDLEEERPPAGGPAYQVIGALVALVVGIGGAVLSYGYGMGSLRQPGPGMWPFVVSIAIALMAAALLVVGRGLSDSEKFTRSSVLPAVGLVTFIVLAMLMPVIGFEIPSLLLCVVWLRFLGGETWRSTIITSVLTVAAFYFLFLYGLRIPLPHLF